MTLPYIAGAEFVGSESCAVCHPDVTSEFTGATHAAMRLPGYSEMDLACESCHGPGSLHVAGGELGPILNPKTDPAPCYQCHLDKKAQADLPFAHAYHNGRVACNDCHDPHVGPAVMHTAMAPTPDSQVCYECHREQAGPFVFAHEAMREGCTLCHEPHGSLNAKMLRVADNNLCLQCHLTEFDGSDVRIGQTGHANLGYLPAGACWTTGCHEAVHGSHVNPNLRF